MKNEQKYSFEDVQEYAYEYNAPFRFGIFLIVLVTNVFWLVRNMLTINNYKETQIVAVITISIMILLSVIELLATAFVKQYKLYSVLRYMTLVFIFFLTAEVVAVVSEKLPDLAASGDQMHGIPLVTLYMFMVVFLPMQTIGEEIFVCVMIMASVIIPRFMPGGDCYDLIPCLVAGVCFVAGSLMYRKLFLKMAYNYASLQNTKSNREDLLQNSMEALSLSLEAKNDYLRGHSKRVGIYAKLIGARLGFPEEIQNGLLSAGYLHDIGKIGTSDSILNKPAKLTDDEFVEIQEHPIEGYTIVNKLGAVPDIAAAVRSHHEKFNGKGYPDGISGDNIPLYGRILCVADACDAMSSARPYRDPLSEAVIIKELEDGCGTQFDPDIAMVMIGLIKDGTMRKVIDLYNEEEKLGQEQNEDEDK